MDRDAMGSSQRTRQFLQGDVGFRADDLGQKPDVRRQLANLPAARPCRLGARLPVAFLLSIKRTTVLAPTPKTRPAARRECPAAT